MATIPKRHLFAYITASAAGDAQATAALASHRVSKARKATKSAPRRQAEATKAQRKQAQHQALVEKVMARAGQDWCELGRHPLPIGWPREPHHLEPGPSKAVNESERNVIVSCRSCHDAYHMNPAAFTDHVRLWCAVNNYPLPNRKEYR